ncbi:MAG TPA: hypothetical protein V6C72_14475, partial [Chroococcales cyanobacterium]
PRKVPTFMPTFILSVLSVVFSFLIFSQPAWADGVPIGVVMMAPMWSSLVMVIPLHALLAMHMLELSSSQCWRLSVVACCYSTIIAIPVTWIGLVVLMAVVWLLMSIFGGQSLLDRLSTLAIFLLSIPWVCGPEPDLHWMIPTAEVLLLIPFFFVSIWTENLVGRRLFTAQSPEAILHWAWTANSVSYAILVLLGIAWLVFKIFKRPM